MPLEETNRRPGAWHVRVQVPRPRMPPSSTVALSAVRLPPAPAQTALRWTKRWGLLCLSCCQPLLATGTIAGRAGDEHPAQPAQLCCLHACMQIRDYTVGVQESGVDKGTQTFEAASGGGGGPVAGAGAEGASKASGPTTGGLPAWFPLRDCQSVKAGDEGATVENAPFVFLLKMTAPSHTRDLPVESAEPNASMTYMHVCNPSPMPHRWRWR